MIESGESYRRSCVSLTGPGERALDREHAEGDGARAMAASATAVKLGSGVGPRPERAGRTPPRCARRRGRGTPPSFPWNEG